MLEITEHIVYIFFTGCLCMALLYHFVLALIQKNRLLMHYSAYLLASTIFVAERVSLEYIFDPSVNVGENFYFNLIDEPVQMMIYFTYMRFASKALDIKNLTSKKISTFYRVVMGIVLLYTLFHIAGLSLGWFDRRTSFAFIGIRIILVCSLFFLLFAVSKKVHGWFFRIIIAGSIIMFVGNVLALISSIADTEILGIYGIMWTCVALVLDVICFSAALGYKARRDAFDKQVAMNQLLATEKELKHQELKSMNALYEARDADRSRIARDLHDDIGSILSSIHIYSSVAEKMLTVNPEKAKQVLEQINVNTRVVMESMSDIVWAMKTGKQQDIRLSNKIKNIGYEMLDGKNIKCNYEITDLADTKDLDIDMRRNILLIVKESMNNIIKYSEATQVNLKIDVDNHDLKIVIADNGIGFNVDTCKKGNGLYNIQYRVKEYGGTMSVVSTEHEGTNITCNFPLTINSD